MNKPTGTPQLVFARPKRVIRLHWFNAVTWLVLTLSGLGIIRGDLRLMPEGYAEWLQNAVGGPFNLILGHSLLGLLWATVFIVFTALNWNSIVYPFLKKVLSVTPKSILNDLKQMGVAIAQLFGFLKGVELPPSGRFNGAQRLLGTMIIFSSLAIVASGVLMFTLFLITPVIVDGAVFRWALVGHVSLVGLVYIGLVAHLYFTLVEEPEVLRSMRDGYLDAEYIRHHCPAWYDELRRDGKLQ